jgi:pimeloyl-ACP methyl ester carboxylesterase
LQFVAIPFTSGGVLQAVINEVLMHWREQGSGEPVLFIHAFPFHGGMWDGQLAALPAGWRGIAPDLRGFGKTSGSGTGPYTMDLFADDLAALLDYLQLDHAVICGLSMGGYAALAFYRKHAPRVRALILCSTRAGADTEEGKQNRRALAARVRADGVRAAVESMLPRLVSDQTRLHDPNKLVVAQQLMLSNQPDAVARALEGLALRPDSEPLLRHIEAPTIIVHGEDDATIPRGEAQILARGIRGSRIKLLPQVGHLPNLESPAEFNRVIGDFLQQLPPFFGVLKFA